MTKRILSLALALVMCLGLAIPAFATEKSGAYELTINGPEGYEPTQVTEKYQVMKVKGEAKGGHTVYQYEEPITSNDITAWVLPLDAEIIISGLKSEEDNYLRMLEDLSLKAWSDPDGDGIYEERVFYWSKEEGSSVLPLTEKGPFTSITGSVSYSTLNSAGVYLRSRGRQDAPGYTSKFYSADSFAELFGPNTLIFMSVTEKTNLTKTKATFTFLLTGESVSAPEEPEQSEEPAAPAITFTDVSADAYYAAPVAWAVEKNITTGTTPTRFSPEEDCTNAQILTFLWRALGRPEPTIINPFTNDIPEPYKKAAVWAYEKGMVSEKVFDANQPCTRAMAVTYIWQAKDSPAPAASASFTDVSADAACAQAVSWAVEQKIVNGTDPAGTLFSPDDVCTRGQIVTLLHRALA